MRYTARIVVYFHERFFSMSNVAVILPAAGQSSRFQGFRHKKPFVELKGRPVWLRSVEHFVNRPDVSEVVLVLAPDDLAEFRVRFQPNLTFLNITLCEGGSSRARSVLNGLKALTKPAEFVAVHDAARPLLTVQWVNEIFAAAQQFGAVIPGVPVSSTVKETDNQRRITRTVDRSRLILAQTPQVFRRTLLENAYTVTENPDAFTDEGSLVEASGHPVFVHEGWPMNIKLTTAEDFRWAEALLDLLPTNNPLASLNSLDNI